MAALYMVIILLMRVVQAIFTKRSSLEIDGWPRMIRFSVLQYAVAAGLAAIWLLFGSGGFRIDGKTVLIASFSGVCLLLATVCGLAGMRVATVSVNSMFATAGMLVPLLSGVFLFDQPITIPQWGGVALFFLAAWLLVAHSRSAHHGFGWKAAVLLTGSMLANGGTMLAQQLFTTYVPDGDVSAFSLISFALIAAGGAVALPFLPRSAPDKSANTPTRSPRLSVSLVVSAAALSLAVFVINQLATLSTALLSPVILFTFINGGGTIISTLVAALMYHEKLTIRSTAGVLIGIASLVIIKACGA